jgi:hypothetical protein
MADTEKVQDSSPIQFRSIEESVAATSALSLKHGATYKCDIFMGGIRLTEVRQKRSIYVVRISPDSEFWHQQEYIDGEQPAEAFHLRSL